MDINEKMITDQIWVDGEWWDYLEQRNPTAEEKYLLVQQVRDEAHQDDSLVVYMALVDCYNDTWYPDTPKFRELLEKRKTLQEWIDATDRELSKIWMDEVYEDDDDYHPTSPL